MKKFPDPESFGLKLMGNGYGDGDGYGYGDGDGYGYGNGYGEEIDP